MTLPQIKGFLHAIAKKNARLSASFISNVAIGAQGDSKGIKKAVEKYLKV